jgi:hypothetical protein
MSAAKKEDNPEEALKAFRALVEQETGKGDWFVAIAFESNQVNLWTGVSRRSSSPLNCFTCA